jgi:hypothetical protein
MPPLQLAPTGQRFPQLPQLFGSSTRLTQPSGQQSCSWMQQTPRQQAECAGGGKLSKKQKTPQPPQLAKSSWVLTQAPPQQLSPLAQALLQTPQLAVVFRFVQTPAQQP